MTNTFFKNFLFSNTNEDSLITKLKDIFMQGDDSSKFDEILSNKQDVLLFDKTINDLKINNQDSKKITLSNGKEITVSLK
ncbi:MULTISPECIES: hypothetical protein [Myroides]|uniref:Uncharacterized protein n=1 Tax=Myroides pelagicus TaxID=270914 RepID=A0A7K1GPE5_9FLAO|nr:hypothetical protein [Myroides pelagicus]MEC4115210.1 hypothetical protein [Myroides pelagicus]MTH30772.1 hypothetical protein [Myroides pelagicus]